MLSITYSFLIVSCIYITINNYIVSGQNSTINIPIITDNVALIIRINDNRDASIIYLGKRLRNDADYASIPNSVANGDYTGLYSSAYTPSGTRNLLEPAIQVIHADGNPSLDLKYVRHRQDTKNQPNGVILTTIYLKDPIYSFEVSLNYKAYYNDNIIEQWTSIKHSETGVVRLAKYSSANLYLASAHNYYLTHFHGDWAQEMKSEQIQLTAGIKVLDTKLGTRADLFQAPSFLVSLNQPINHDDDDQGEILAGTLAWSGNYQLQFEIDPLGNLRLLTGISPYASEYYLVAEQEFITPSFLFTYSSYGIGTASRNWHRWARKYRIPQGENNRLTLLNNWESTYFNFNETILTSLMKDGKKLGVDLFLLDDGWFGNKYPRNDDHAGLGDWQENVKKLPHGIDFLTNAAETIGIKFGIWLEPEMVNPKSELYENHLDWVLKVPSRPEYYFRNQLVLDLTNPAVQDFVYSTIDGMFTKHPMVAYVKWDCNSVIYNAYSSTNPHQSHLYIDYVRSLYNILNRLRNKYPTIPMMLCSGGGGRVDYGALQYFTEFWPSDNTDALERIFIQWSYSFFFPAIATCNHVTDWGKQSLKFRTDVAMMGKLGYDIVVSELDSNELLFSQQALQIYDRLKDTIWHGDLFRLVSPYRSGNDVASLIFVNEQRDHAVWFTYLINNRYRAGTSRPIRLKGIDPTKIYKFQEINIYPGTDNLTVVYLNNLSGDYLMTFGFDPMVNIQRPSVIIEFQLTNGVQILKSGNHLHGSYRYALYESYGLSRSNIESIYIVAYTSSLVIGTFAASLADLYGRRLGCLLSNIFFIVMVILMNFSSLWILIISGIFSGTADALHLTAFDAWLLQEYRECSLDDTSLKRILRDANIGVSLISIGASVFAQVLVKWSNYTAPFNMSVVFFTVSLICIWKFWSENYGNKDAKATHSFILAIQILRADPRIVVLGLCIASFEASLFLFIM
ncbi:unnamed protein product, partial [Adineta steineri]